MVSTSTEGHRREQRTSRSVGLIGQWGEGNWPALELGREGVRPNLNDKAEASVGKRARKRSVTNSSGFGPPPRFRPRWAVALLAFFALSLALRLYGGLSFGVDLDGPGTFQMINYDEGGSCRAVSRIRPLWVIKS